MTSTHCPQPPKLEWWAFLIMAFGVFAVFLLINFIVKKFNDTRIKERYRKMYDGSNNRGTQVKESLELGYQEQKKRTSVSFVFDKDENLKMKNRKDLFKSGPKFRDDKYISDWMIVYGRKKSYSDLAIQRTRNISKTLNTDKHLTESEREDLKLWFEILINLMLNAAITAKETITT